MSPITFTNADGVEYTIYWRKPKKRDLKGCRAKEAEGLCRSPDSKNPKILINPKLLDKNLLGVLCEEIFHSFVFDQNEKTARKFAHVLTTIIYELGWRRVNTGEIKKKRIKK